MENSSNENSEHSTISSNNVDQQCDNPALDQLNHGVMEAKPEVAHEEVKCVLELIALTGKFWLDWDKLKSLLSFQLKQVLSEYPEAKMSSGEQTSALGETFMELGKKMDDALCSFIEGPPFTLQRLCEILLTARIIYPNVLKLALALEKNLLVTSTLTRCTDPYPPHLMLKLDEPEKANEAEQEKANEAEQEKANEAEPEKANEEPQVYSNSVPNGVEAVVGDGDEIMAEVEEADVGEDMTIDTEVFEEIAGSSESNSTQNNNS